MSDIKYDSEKLEKEAQDFIDSFKTKLTKIADETISNLYVNIMPYAETDTWTNYREALRLELEHDYRFSIFKDDWAKNFRKAIFIENKEELAELISKDLLEKIKKLEDQIQEFDMFRYSSRD